MKSELAVCESLLGSATPWPWSHTVRTGQGGTTRGGRRKWIWDLVPLQGHGQVMLWCTVLLGNTRRATGNVSIPSVDVNIVDWAWVCCCSSCLSVSWFFSHSTCTYTVSIWLKKTRHPSVYHTFKAAARSSKSSFLMKLHLAHLKKIRRDEHFSFTQAAGDSRSLLLTFSFEHLSKGQARNPPIQRTKHRGGADGVQMVCTFFCSHAPYPSSEGCSNVQRWIQNMATTYLKWLTARVLFLDFRRYCRCTS